MPNYAFLPFRKPHTCTKKNKNKNHFGAQWRAFRNMILGIGFVNELYGTGTVEYLHRSTVQIFHWVSSKIISCFLIFLNFQNLCIFYQYRDVSAVPYNCTVRAFGFGSASKPDASSNKNELNCTVRYRTNCRKF